MLNYLKKIDIVVLNWINISFRNKTFDRVMPLITSAGNLGIVWIVISVLLVIGVNGVGKTTSIGKISAELQI